MPNIEVHGLAGYQNDDLNVVFERIRKCLKSASYIDEMVVTFAQDTVFDMKGEPAPFLRVLWTPETTQEELTDLERRLCTLEPLMDLEFEPLAKFKSAKDIKTEREQILEKLRSLRPVAGSDANFNYEKGRLYTEAELEQSRLNQPGNHID